MNATNSADVIIQFNNCLHNSRIKSLSVDRWFVFNVAPTGIPHGFDHQLNPPCDLGDGKVFLDTSKFKNHKTNKAALRSHAEHSDFRKHIGPYNLEALGYEPSIGYLTACYFAQQGHEVTLVGFTGEFADGGWIGHHFDLERLLLSNQPGVQHFHETIANQLTVESAFSQVFSNNYNFTAGPVILMLDIAKALWRSGHKEIGKRFIDQAICRNPGNIRAIDELAALDGLDIQSLRLPKSQLNNFWTASRGLQMPEFEAITSGPNHSYRLERNSKKRFLLINNTASLQFNKFHVGCKIVVEQILAQADSHGMTCVGWFNEPEGLAEILKIDPSLSSVDAIILNGEGTFHDDAARAFSLLALCNELKTHFSKKLFFINGVWQNNGLMLERMLKAFDLVSLRDTASFDDCSRSRDCLVTPDLTWNVPRQIKRHDTRELAVVDSVYPDVSAQLRDLASHFHADYFVMGRFYVETYDNLIRGGKVPLVAKDADGFAHYDRVITGRFHGACLALMAGATVNFIESNTHKIEIMFEEIGLSDRHYDLTAKLETTSFSANENMKVEKYHMEAQSSIDALFCALEDAMD